NLLQRQLRDAAIAATRIGEQRMRILDRALSALDGNIHISLPRRRRAARAATPRSHCHSQGSNRSRAETDHDLRSGAFENLTAAVRRAGPAFSQCLVRRTKSLLPRLFV